MCSELSSNYFWTEMCDEYTQEKQPLAINCAPKLYWFIHLNLRKLKQQLIVINNIMHSIDMWVGFKEELKFEIQVIDAQLD